MAAQDFDVDDLIIARDPIPDVFDIECPYGCGCECRDWPADAGPCLHCYYRHKERQ
jgi:hypothetical protein